MPPAQCRGSVNFGLGPNGKSRSSRPPWLLYSELPDQRPMVLPGDYFDPGRPINLRIAPYSLWKPDVHPRSIEPLVPILLVCMCPKSTGQRERTMFYRSESHASDKAMRCA